RQSFGLNAALIHEARVIVPDLLRDASLRRLRCSGLLNEVANALAGSRRENGPGVEAWLALGNGYRLQPAAIGVVIEVIPGLDRAIDVLGSVARRRCWIGSSGAQ